MDSDIKKNNPFSYLLKNIGKKKPFQLEPKKVPEVSVKRSAIRSSKWFAKLQQEKIDLK